MTYLEGWLLKAAGQVVAVCDMMFIGLGKAKIGD